MKTKIQTLLLILACLEGAARAAVTFNLTPATVSSAYTGMIALQITGLTNIETVVVQKFLDLNGNGVVDAGDWLVQQFDLTDGLPGMAIGGITNLNIPGDTDTVPGQITAELFFRNGDFMQNIVGQYIYVVSSPTGRFGAVTNLLTVTNAGYAQAFTGNVVSNNTSTTLPNSMVFLLGPGKGKPVAGTLTDQSGNYTVAAPPGTYKVMAVQPNYVVNTGTLPSISLGSGATNTANVSLTAATASISGIYVDAGNTNLGLPGIMVTAQANDGGMGFGCTDAGGNFTIGVQSGQWSVGPNDTSFIVNGYLRLQDDTNIAAGTAGVIFALPKANALFYGIVLDSLGYAIPGLEMQASDNYNYEGESFTGTNGEFAVGALGGLRNDQWQIQVSSDSDATNYIFSQPDFEQNGGTNLSSGQSVLAVFTGLLATNTISGSLTDGSGNPFVNIGIWANATINGVYYSPHVDTDSQGHYSFSVGNGSWTVGVNNHGGSDNLPTNYVCPSQTVGISNANATVNFVATVPTNTISGTLKDNNGNPIGGVQVWANAGNNREQADTDGSGHYSLTVGSGSWTVGINASGTGDSLPSSYLCPQNQTVVIANNNGAANFTAMQTTQTITGSLLDGSGNPIAGVGLCAYVQINGAGYNAVVCDTDATGHYSLGAVNGNWQVYLLGPGGSDSLPDSYLYPSGQSVQVLNAGGTANFVALLATQTIYGSVKDSSGNPIAGVGVTAWMTNNSVVYNVSTDADAGGNYTLNAAAGVWDVMLNCGSSSDSLGNLGNYICPGGQLIKISGSSGTVNFIVKMCGGISVSPSMPAGEVGVYYDQYLQASSCNNSFTWSLLSGSAPPGLTGDPVTGEITGTPTEAGDFNFTLQVTDGGSLTTNAQITINIRNPVQITTDTLPNGTNGSAYSQQLRATGGQTPYTWSLYSGNLPPGLGMTSGGLISGDPTSSGVFSFSAQVSDNLSGLATSFFPINLTILPATNGPALAAPEILPNGRFQFLLNGAAGQNYTLQMSTNLGSTAWTSLYVTNCATNGSFYVTDANAAGNARFYRVKVGP